MGQFLVKYQIILVSCLLAALCFSAQVFLEAQLEAFVLLVNNLDLLESFCSLNKSRLVVMVNLVVLCGVVVFSACVYIYRP